MSSTGKIRRTSLGKSHLRRRKSARAKAKFGELQTVTNKAMARRVKRLAPYLKKK